MQEFLATWTPRVADLANLFAMIIIALATLEAAVRSAMAFAQLSREHQGIQLIRWRFGRWLSLALDFLIAGDILRTSVTPSWTDIGQLGAIVAIRVIITAALGKEISDSTPTTSGATPAAS